MWRECCTTLQHPLPIFLTRENHAPIRGVWVGFPLWSSNGGRLGNSQNINLFVFNWWMLGYLWHFFIPSLVSGKLLANLAGVCVFWRWGWRRRLIPAVFISRVSRYNRTTLFFLLNSSPYIILVIQIILIFLYCIVVPP